MLYIKRIFDLANRFARSKQLLCRDDNNIRKLNSLDPLRSLTPSYFNMIGRGKGGKE